MSEQRRPPADMLLLRERQRRLRAASPPSTPSPASPTPASGEVLLVESDAIVEETPLVVAPPAVAGAISLYRPLTHVTLARMPWSGAVDHVALQNAIVCSPPRDGGGAKAPGWLSAVTTSVLANVPTGEPALYVSLGPDDVAVLSRVGMRLTHDDAISLVRASALPAAIVGADAATVSPAATVLAGYRHVALVHAWQVALCGAASSEMARERDAAAVQLLSMLRALLGEA